MAAFIIGLISIAITQKPDNVVEEAAEVVLQSQGINVDLSPDE